MFEGIVCELSVSLLFLLVKSYVNKNLIRLLVKTCIIMSFARTTNDDIFEITNQLLRDVIFNQWNDLCSHNL